MDKRLTVVVELGRALMRGALVEFARWFFLGLIIVVVLSHVAAGLGYGWDATDDRIQREHSQMHLRIDYGTRCQYLESAGGGLTPRMGANGKQVCR